MELDYLNKLLLLKICAVLNKIAANANHNNMTVFNLSVCIAPSLLWPPSTAGPFTQADSTRKVAEIIQFILNNEEEIFCKVLPNADVIEWSDESDDDSAESEVDEVLDTNGKSTFFKD